MARIRRTKPCPTPEPPKDPEDRKELARSFGLKGADKVRFTDYLKYEKEVPWWVTSLMSMDFAARKHPVMREMVRRLMYQADEAKRIDKQFGARWDDKSGFDRRSGAIRRMTETEQGEYMRAMLATEQKDWLTDDQLRDMKLSKKAADLYRFHRRVMPQALNIINYVRKVKGLEPIKGIKGVMFPHEFDGNFHLQKEGKPLYIEGGSAWDTQADAWDALAKHFAKHPEDVGHVDIIADYQKRLSYAVLGDLEQWGPLNSVLADVARGSGVSADKTAQWWHEGRKKTGFGTHMLPRMGHEGYDTTNVIRVMSEYLHALPWWATAEVAREDLRNLAGQIDPAKEPHTTAAFSRYVAQTFGLPGSLEMQLDQFINNLAKGKAGRALVKALTPLESMPLVRRPAQFLNPARMNPVRPTRRATMRGRALTSDLKLGFISWGVTIAHMLHAPTNILPAYGAKYFAKGIRSVFLRDLPKSVHDWGAYHDAFKSRLMDDAPDGPFTRTIARIADKVGANDTTKDIIMSVWRPISQSERLLRESAFYGAYHALRDQGETGTRLLRLATDDAIKEFPKLDKYTERFLLEHAKRVVDQVAFRYDRSSRPWWTTSAPIGLLGGQFKTYVMGTIALQKRLWDMGYKGRSLAPIGVMMALGGIAGGVPLVHQLDDAFRYLTATDRDGKGGISLLDEAYLFLRHNAGPDAAEAIYRGIPALLGLDIGRRVGYSHLHLESMKDVLGAFPSTIMDTVTALHFHDLEHATMLAPGIGNLYQAFQWMRDGGAADPFHRDRLRFSTTQWDVFKRAVGLEPLIQAQTTDMERISSRKATKLKVDRSGYIDRMVKAWKAGDDDEYTRLDAEAAEHDLTITPTDILKELNKKQRSAIARRYDTMPKALRPWFLQEWGPELEGEQNRQDANAAQRALENAQQQGPQPPGTVAVPGELPP